MEGDNGSRDRHLHPGWHALSPPPKRTALTDHRVLSQSQGPTPKSSHGVPDSTLAQQGHPGQNLSPSQSYDSSQRRILFSDLRGLLYSKCPPPFSSILDSYGQEVVFLVRRSVAFIPLPLFKGRAGSEDHRAQSGGAMGLFCGTGRAWSMRGTGHVEVVSVGPGVGDG